MSRSLSALVLLPCLTALCTLVPAAHANTISGVAYCNISSADASNTPAPGIPSSGTECATFTASSLNFFTGGGNDNSLGSFLNYGGGIVGPINYLNGFDANASMDDSFFQFTGFANFNQGETYNVWHDDGTVMNVDGTTVFNAPSPVSLVNSQFVFNEASGNYAFVYDYTEQGGMSAFGTDADASPTPEPGSLLLLGTGAVCLFFVARRGRNTALHQLVP